jgi:cbb3-type cytochrome oxidase subunit 3
MAAVMSVCVTIGFAICSICFICSICVAYRPYH